MSLLTTISGYSIAAVCLLTMALFCYGIEYFWIEVVFKGFPILQSDEDGRPEEEIPARRQRRLGTRQNWKGCLEQEKEDWMEFSRLPIFCSERP